jgi:hypothetical protein
VKPSAKKDREAKRVVYQQKKSDGNAPKIHKEVRRKYAQKYKEDGRAMAAQRKSRYGLTDVEYQEMLEKQNGLCAACNLPFGNRTKAVDHCHETGVVRGIVHRQCNSMMGLASDNPEILERAAAYLRKARNE